MQSIQAVALSVLISLTTWLNDGLKKFEEKKYDDAIPCFTKIIEKDNTNNRFKDIALYYRAKSFHQQKKKEKSLADLESLLKEFPSSPFTEDSKKLYEKWGGDLTKLFPKDSPKKVWAKFVAAAVKADLKTALSLSTGDWKKLVMKEAGDDPDELRDEFGKKEFKVGEEIIGKGDKAGTAILKIAPSARKFIDLEFILDKKTNSWKIAGFQELRMRNNRRHVHDDNNSNINKLKQIGLACRMYSNVYQECFPNELNDLKTEGFLENDDIYIWTNPKNNEQLPFIYCPGLTESDSVDNMLAAAPMAVDDQREVLWLDGHVKTISEKEFVKNAKEQKWKIPALVKKEDIPEKTKKQILALIKKLGDKNFQTRKDAKNELKKIGIDAFPFLEEQKNNPDPEVKISIKEILKGK